MNFVRNAFALLVLSALCACGCGRSQPSASSGGQPDLNTVRNVLEQLAKGGEPSGTQLMGMRMGLEGLKKTDPAKAQALDKDAEEIMRLAQKNPQAVQAKAQEMLKKLDAGTTGPQP